MVGAWCVSGIYNYTFIELVQSKLQLQAKSSLLEGFNKEFPPENRALHHLPSVSGFSRLLLGHTHFDCSRGWILYMPGCILKLHWINCVCMLQT